MFNKIIFNKKATNQVFLFLAVFLIFGALVYAQANANDFESEITAKTTQFRSILKNVAIVSVIIGLLTGACAVMFDFKDNATLRKSLIGIGVGLVVIALISGIVGWVSGMNF